MWFALAGAALGMMSGAKDNKAQNAAIRNKMAAETANQVKQQKMEGEQLIINANQIALNRQQLDDELGSILSDNALATAKNIATASVLMSGSGTIGGTSAMVSKQAYVDKINADATVISQARNQEIGLLTKALSDRINFKNRSNTLASNIDAIIAGNQPIDRNWMQAATQGIQGAQAGMQFQQSAKGAFAPTQNPGESDSDYKKRLAAHWTNW
jgi:hypothetical protein